MDNEIDLSHRIARQLWVKAGQIKTVEDMAKIIRESVLPLEQELAVLSKNCTRETR